MPHRRLEEDSHGRAQPRHLRRTGKSADLNLPGSPHGAAESLETVIDLLPHVLALLGGDTKHT